MNDRCWQRRCTRRCGDLLVARGSAELRQRRRARAEMRPVENVRRRTRLLSGRAQFAKSGARRGARHRQPGGGHHGNDETASGSRHGALRRQQQWVDRRCRREVAPARTAARRRAGGGDARSRGIVPTASANHHSASCEGINRDGSARSRCMADTVTSLRR